MSRISVNLLLFFHHPSTGAVAHRPILPVIIGEIHALEGVCPMCRGTKQTCSIASPVVPGLVPEGVKPTVRHRISLQICLTVGETGKRS